MKFILVLLVLTAIAALAIAHFRRPVPAPTTADDAAPSTVFVFVRIPESIMPVDRGKRYEDPLHAALTEAGLGEVTGGGSQLGAPNPDGTSRIEWVGVDVELIDLANGLPFLKAALKRLGAPPSTTLEFKVGGRRTSETL